jgi:transcriptional regulator with XRE-family HTH domain
MKPDPEPLRIILSRNIRKFRGNLQFTQEKLAEKADLSTQTLSDIEGCRRWVSDKTLTKLAKALNVSEYQLLYPENEDFTNGNRRSSLKSLLALKKTLKSAIDNHVDRAIETGDFT